MCKKRCVFAHLTYDVTSIILNPMSKSIIPVIFLLLSDSSNDVNNSLSIYKKRILIVDDEADITLTLKKALIHNGFENVETYNDPLLALNHFTANSYDLLILDIVMPQIDGFALYEKMKKIDKKVKVCFITAFDVNYQALRAVFPAVNDTDELGCFIRKPIEVQQLLKHVKGELDQSSD